MLKITYLFESTTLWGGNKVGLEQAEALSDSGHKVTILSKDAGPAWYPVRLPVIQADRFDAAVIPESDIIVGTYWPTVKAAYESGHGTAVHLCQGYEGDYKELSHVKQEIDEVYSYKIPKLTVSLHLNELLKERFNAKTYYVGQMLDDKVFYPDSSGVLKKILLRRDLTGHLSILVVGPFNVDFKNIAAALRGITIAKKRFDRPVKLIRASQFPLSLDEELIIKPDVYHYHVPHNKMGGIYRDADLFISMSREAEGFGLPALEAMACGVPVILSRIPSYMSFDETADYAAFVDSSDPESIAKTIQEVVSNKPLRDKLIRRGLEVAGKFTKEKVLERLTAAFEEIHYKAKLSKTKSTWNDFHAGKTASKKYWWDSPVILGHCQKLVTGHADMNIYQFLKKSFIPESLEKGLSICSGSGEFERGVIDNGICKHIDAYEIAEARVNEGVRLSKEKGYAIEFYMEDANRALFKSGHYDIFFSWAALHHIENLEGVCRNVSNALKENGLLVVQEFIGPNQFQWTDKQLEIANKVLSILPERLRIKPETGEVITRVKRPTLTEMNISDPSEAIRAKDIIPVLEKFFKIKTIRYFGGSFYNLLLGEIIGNFNHDDEKDTALLKTILMMEQTLTEEKILDNDYAVIVAEKR